eukprot:CAMPEP_0171427640 /NCGR_PEP_ID=MMETSP0881-20121228/4747_1 /TAXON_ID=67004 /ORGANISM="Thalassiosira weissflogii, Strain CCMP1336" /LENGTH=46 /DNA_ID= /DNA_START= /DNA_END= /DNA_ORIENTATION=
MEPSLESAAISPVLTRSIAVLSWKDDAIAAVDKRRKDKARANMVLM